MCLQIKKRRRRKKGKKLFRYLELFSSYFSVFFAEINIIVSQQFSCAPSCSFHQLRSTTVVRERK